jgi:hypothetical protein
LRRPWPVLFVSSVSWSSCGLLFDLVITSQDLHRPVDFIVRDIDNSHNRAAIKIMFHRPAFANLRDDVETVARLDECV